MTQFPASSDSARMTCQSGYTQKHFTSYTVIHTSRDSES